jgi:hypothetical protein
METLYFHYLLECPQQYGVHEQAAGTRKLYRFVPLSSPAGAAKQLAAITVTRPKFFCLHDDTGAASPGDVERIGKIMRMFLKLYYWRRSSFEK